MGCQIKRPSNVYNFVAGHRVSDVSISDLSGDIVFCADIVTPPQLFGSAANSTEFTLNWIPQGGETGFKVYRSTDDVSYSLIATLGGVAAYTNTGLDPETLYYYKVKAVGITGDSTFSNTVSDTTPELEAPILLNLTDVQLEEITNNWTSSTGGREDGFKIERSLTGVGAWSEVGGVGSGILTYIDDTPPLDHGTTYYYRVYAYVGAFNSDYTNVASDTTPTMAAPSGLVASLPSAPSQIQLDWVSNSGSEEDGFSIERSLTGVGAWSEIGTTSTNVVTFTDKNNVLPSTTYYYRVRATEEQGNSDYSNIDSGQIDYVAVMFGDYQFGQNDFGEFK